MYKHTITAVVTTFLNEEGFKDMFQQFLEDEETGEITSCTTEEVPDPVEEDDEDDEEDEDEKKENDETP